MSKGWSYSPGEWYITCDVCGKKMKSSKARHRWDGFIVCDADFEHRHPQDFLKVKPDNLTVPFSRPKETPVFIEVDYIDTDDANYCTIGGKAGQADYGTSDCARTDNIVYGI